MWEHFQINLLWKRLELLFMLFIGVRQYTIVISIVVVLITICIIFGITYFLYLHVYDIWLLKTIDEYNCRSIAVYQHVWSLLLYIYMRSSHETDVLESTGRLVIGSHSGLRHSYSCHPGPTHVSTGRSVAIKMQEGYA